MQVKTRGAGAWPPSLLVDLSSQWAALPATDDAIFEFHTDATLSAAACSLHAAAQRTSQHAAVAQDATVIARAQLSAAQVDILGRARFLTRLGSPAAVLALSQVRLIHLRRDAGDPVDVDAAGRLLASLFVELQLRAGNASNRRATIDTAEIATSLGLRVAPSDPGTKTPARLLFERDTRYFCARDGGAYVRMAIHNPTTRPIRGTAVVVERIHVNGEAVNLRSALRGAASAVGDLKLAGNGASHKTVQALTQRYVLLGWLRANDPLFLVTADEPFQIRPAAEDVHVELALTDTGSEPRRYDALLRLRTRPGGGPDFDLTIRER